jgi:hypothetical protein
MTTVLVADTDPQILRTLWILARLRAVLRRTVAAAGARENQLIDTGTFTVDLAAKKVWRDGSQVRLTPIEWVCWRSSSDIRVAWSRTGSC